MTGCGEKMNKLDRDVIMVLKRRGMSAQKLGKLAHHQYPTGGEGENEKQTHLMETNGFHEGRNCVEPQSSTEQFSAVGNKLSCFPTKS